MKSNDMLRKLAAANPRSADIQFYLGLIAAKRDRNPAAIRRYFTKLNALCPDYPDARAHLYMGIIHYSDERYGEAVTELERFFEIANQNSDPKYDAVYAEASNYLHWSKFLDDALRNQVPFSPRAVTGVSTRDDEMMPYITPDGKSMFFLRQVNVNPKPRTYYARSMEEKQTKICYSQWKDSSFTIGVVMGEPFNQYIGEGGVTVTADGNDLYYSVMRYTASGYTNVDIFHTHKSDGRWGKTESVSPMVNGEKTWEAQPSITADGQYLYFASNRKGGYGGTDIWRCRRLSDGGWSRPENLGPAVNTAGNEKSPFIHADGHTLYFASNGWQGFGGYDMYFINIDDTYRQCPTNMGLPINGEGDDICFGVTTAGNEGYFAKKDIYLFDLYAAARPESMRLSSFTLNDGNGSPIGGTVEVRHGGVSSQYIADSINGQCQLMLSQQKDNIVVARSNGYVPCVVSLRGDEVKRGIPPSRLHIRLQPTAKGGHYPIVGPIEVYADFLLEHPQMSVCIEAPHAADAKTAYDSLLKLKLRPERLSWRGGTDVGTQRMTIVEDSTH